MQNNDSQPHYGIRYAFAACGISFTIVFLLMLYEVSLNFLLPQVEPANYPTYSGVVVAVSKMGRGSKYLTVMDGDDKKKFSMLCGYDLVSSGDFITVASPELERYIFLKSPIAAILSKNGKELCRGHNIDELNSKFSMFINALIMLFSGISAFYTAKFTKSCIKWTPFNFP